MTVNGNHTLRITANGLNKQEESYYVQSVKVNGKHSGKVKTRDAISYSMARYLAGEERHEKIAQGITSARK